ncbi:MAG: type II 3-dehydroquinate dehydratase [Eubacteriales bacterium]|jgi:3-dehydroquinate dehydratase-2|nr:type II 3-dehydroquinate dehydratase [Eubacteriales bacterium]
MKKLLIINGPNINLLGLREPDLYGRDTYEDLVRRIEKACKKHSFECKCFQSNHEGALVDEIQEARGRFDGIVINPAAYTHTSIAILDALRAVGIPAVEVHLTDISAREEYRRISFAGKACVRTIAGHGPAGYEEAITFLEDYLKHPASK